MTRRAGTIGYISGESTMPAVRKVFTEFGENSELSFVERVCDFLERYAIAHASEAEPTLVGEIAKSLPELA